MNRKLILSLVCACIVATVSIGALVGTDASGRPAPAPVAKPFDPVAAALGATTPSKRLALQVDQRQLAAHLGASSRAIRTAPGGMGSTPAPSATSAADVKLRAAVANWSRAVDDLYSRVSRAPGSSEARKMWLECMASRGRRVESRDRLIAQLDAPDASPDEVVALGNDIDRCDGQTRPQLDATVRALYPQWKADHSDDIAAYQAALRGVGG
ncbi:MAG: hypothetical protein U0P45_11150 [Acidimicrobiales bacterium]